MKIIRQSEHLLTVGDSAQFVGMFNGPFMQGHREPRMAIVGRSNVGKSSLINAMMGLNLAQTSKQPGKTRKIHFYYWKETKKILVDLPGYGYARAGKDERDKWEIFIRSYFKEDQNLEQVILILDARHGPTDVDRQAIEFLSLRGIPVTFVFAKSDTLKTQSQRATRHRDAARTVKELGFEESELFWVSAYQKLGLKELKTYLGKRALEESTE